MFGYTSKSEMLYKNVTLMMPLIFSTIHDKILKKFLETNELKLANSERFLYGKIKNGYIFPIYLIIKPVYH